MRFTNIVLDLIAKDEQVALKYSKQIQQQQKKR